MRAFARASVSAIVCTAGLHAQMRLTLMDAVSQAFTGNSQMASAAARVATTEGLRRQAGLGPNPRLILQAENARLSGRPPFSYARDADSYAIVAQTIETGGKRDLRVGLATENVRLGEAAQQLRHQQIASRVAIAYWIAAGTAKTRDLLQQEAADFEAVVQYHRDRVREGGAPEVDLIRIEVERDKVASLAQTAAQEADRARIALFREMGKSEFPLIEFADNPEVVRPIVILPLGEVLEKRPETRVARQNIEQALANQRLQRANAKPDPDLQIGYKRTSGFNTLFAAVQIPLPIRNRNQGQIEAAIAGTTEAQANLAANEALIRSELESATKDYNSRQKLIRETLRPMRARVDEVYRIETAAYREGGSNVLRLLDAERSRIETLVMYTRALSELQESAVALETAQGNQP